MMYCDLSNEDRVNWARSAVKAFLAASRDPDPDFAIQDLICDLLHLAHREGHKNPVKLLDIARMHFEAES
jgi:hypothetical protein